MLKQRVISGAVLVPIVALSVLKLAHHWLALLLAIVALAAAWEWSDMVASRLMARLFYMLVCALLLALAGYGLDENQVRFLMLAGSGYWVFILLLLSFYQPNWLGNYLLNSFLHYSGYAVITIGWLAMTALHEQEPARLLGLGGLIWVADSAAYFGGNKFGRSKLAPALSPGKTHAGVLAAMAGALAWSLPGLWVWRHELQPGAAVYFVMLCLLSALISVAGDLFESLLKRHAGKKDSGTLIPGHGGVLDRIDSILAAAPGFMLGCYWL